MPNISGLILAMMANSKLFQFPTKQLYNAAVTLKPSDRPTVPVSPYTDPNKAYGAYGLPGNSYAAAFTPQDKKSIHVYTKNPDYGDNKLLAATLAHEQRHITGGDEYAAKQKELQVLQGLGVNSFNPQVKSLEDYIRLFKK